MKFKLLVLFLFGLSFAKSFGQSGTAVVAGVGRDFQVTSSLPTGKKSSITTQWLQGGIFEGKSPDDEVIGNRTEFTKKFKRPDGQVDILFGGPFHYKDNLGAWQDIDLTIKEQVASKFKYTNLENRFSSRFAAKCIDGVQMESKEGLIAFGLSPVMYTEGWSPSVTTVGVTHLKANTITYQSIYDGVDLQYSISTDMIQHRVFFKNKSVFAGITSQQYVSLEETVEIPSNGVLVDRKGEVSTGREVEGIVYVVVNRDTLFSILPPRVWDATFSESELTLLGDNLPEGVSAARAFVSVISKNRIKYTANIPSKWLLDESRVFPIVFDPTVYLGGITSPAFTYRYPFNTCRAQRADQILFHGSDIGTSGTITSVGFYQVTNTGQNVNNINIKMQEGGFADFSTCTFVSSGWTTCVPSTSLSASGSGWRDFSFSTPFIKTGATSNLLIETKFNNCASSPMLTPGCSCSLTAPGGYWGAVSGLYYGHRWAFSNDCTPPPTSCPSAFDPCYGTGLENNTGYGTIIPLTRITVSSSCSGWYTVPTASSLPASSSTGNTFSVYVSSGTGCSYYATSSDSWINSIAYPGASNIVSYSVDANVGSARSGTISIRDGSSGSVVTTFAINQAAAVSCTSPFAVVNDASGTGSVMLACSPFGGSGGGYLYKWYSGSSCSGGVIGTGPTLTVGTSGYYTCKVYISGNESTCYDCDYGYATVGPVGVAPIANFTPSATSITYGSSVAMANTSTGTSPLTYNWSVTPSTGVLISPSSIASSPVIRFANASTYTVTLVASNAFGASSKTKVIRASPGAPTSARVIEEDYPMCRVAEPIDVGTASYGYKHTDFNIPTVNSALNFTRYYNSVNANLSSALGYGWSHTYDCYVTNYADTIWSVHYADGHNCFFVPLYGGGGTSFPLYGGVYESLYKNPSTGNFSLTFKTGEVYTFNSLGKLSSITDLNGNITTIFYSGSNMDSVVGPGGRALYFNYTGPYLTSVSDPLNRTVTYGHGGGGDLTLVTNADMHSTAIGYTGSHLIKYIVNPLGDTLLSNTYDGTNRVVAQSDALHLTTHFSYNNPNVGDATITYPGGDSEVVHHDDFFRMTQRTDELGHIKQYIYDVNNNIDTFIDENGRILTFDHDPSGNLIETHRPGGRTTTLTYNSLNKIETIRNTVGHTDSVVYDAHGNATSVYLPNGGRLEFFYNSLGLPDSAHDAMGNSSYYHYNGFGDLTSVTTAAGTQYFSYDTVGRVTTFIDANSVVTRFGYTGSDKLKYIIDPYSDTVSYLYDADDNLIRFQDKRGLISTLNYDAKGRLRRVRHPNNGLERLGYDARDNLVADTNANGNVIAYSYDARKQIKSVTTALGANRFGYDAARNMVSDTDALGGVRVFNYDSLNQVDSILDEVGGYATLTYDSLGQVKAIRDPMGRSTGYHRNVIGRIDSVLDAIHNTTSAGYNLNGDLTTLRDPMTHPLTYRYDASRRLTSVTNSSGVVDSFQYDPTGNVVTQRNRLGTISKTYDSLNRITHISNTGGNNYYYAYDKNDNVTSAENSHGTATFVFDSLDHLTRYIDMFGDTVSYTYDLAGNKRTIRYPGGHIVRYGYNDVNLLDSVTDWLGNVTRYSYDANGRLKLILNPHNDTCKYTYNAAGQLIGHVNVIGSHVISKDAYSVNSNGEKEGDDISGKYPKHFQERSFVYNYDNTDVLLSDSVNTYVHDSAGNRKKDMLQSGATISDSFSVDNFLLSRTDSTGTVTFQYDALGNRVVRVKGSAYRRFVHDLSGRLPQVLVEMDSTGAIKANYIYGIGLISRIDSAGNILYYHFNAQHNTIALSNDSGVVTDTYTYEDYGTLHSHTGTTEQPYTFLGQYGVEQETPTLYYMRARYYDAANQRFLSKDPYPITLENPQTINRYIYALNNPLEYFDPTGLYGEKDNTSSVGQPGFGESLIPVWGSARAAVDDFQNGRWGWGIFNTVMAVSDIFLVKSLATIGGKFVLKAGVEVSEFVAKRVIKKEGMATVNGLSFTAMREQKVLGNLLNTTLKNDRIIPSNLTEKLALEEIKSNPAMGKVIMTKLKDPARAGWVKMRSTNAGVEIHFFAKKEGDVIRATEGFKFK